MVFRDMYIIAMHAYHVTRMEVNNEEIMKKILAFIVFTGFIILALGQDGKKTLSGEVTYVTSQSVYVKFENTEDIEVGSMLQLASTQTPCLLVKNKSTTSCVCTTIRSCEVKKGDKIIFTPEKKSSPLKTVSWEPLLKVIPLQSHIAGVAEFEVMITGFSADPSILMPPDPVVDSETPAYTITTVPCDMERVASEMAPEVKQ